MYASKWLILFCEHFNWKKSRTTVLRPYKCPETTSCRKCKLPLREWQAHWDQTTPYQKAMPEDTGEIPSGNLLGRILHWAKLFLRDKSERLIRGWIPNCEEVPATTCDLWELCPFRQAHHVRLRLPERRRVLVGMEPYPSPVCASPSSWVTHLVWNKKCFQVTWWREWEWEKAFPETHVLRYLLFSHSEKGILRDVMEKVRCHTRKKWYEKHWEID